MKTEMEENPELYTILDPSTKKTDSGTEAKYKSLVEKIKGKALGEEVVTLEINDERALEIKNLKENMD